MKKKQTIELIKKYLNDGKSQEDIYKELSPSCHYSDQKLLVKLIVELPTKANKEKYKSLNIFLFVLLVLQTGLKILSSLSLPYVSHNLWWLFILPLINIILAIEVLKMSAPVYKLIVFAEFVSVLRVLPTPTSITFSGWFFFSISLIGIISALSIYLGKRIFPNYSSGFTQKFSSDNKAELKGFLPHNLVWESNSVSK